MCLGLYSFLVDENHDGSTVKTFLRQGHGLSAAVMTALKKTDNGITRKGELLKAHDILHTGDRVNITLPKEICNITPIPGRLDILYQDKRVLVVNKPASMPVHPTKRHQTDTLANIVAFYQQRRGESCIFRALNRLDKDTSGCVIMAKDSIAYSMISPTVSKKYLAVCHGRLAESGTVDKPMGLTEKSKMRRYVFDGGDRAVTHYRTLKSDDSYSLCELTLETGRTHQIRCHLSFLGHPLIGDTLYDGSDDILSRQALHCTELSFIHPDTGKRIDCTAKLFTDIQNALKATGLE